MRCDRIAAALLLATGGAVADAQRSATLHLRAITPVICEMRAPVIRSLPGETSGPALLRERCNDVNGYLVVARHRPLMMGEQAVLVYDGRPVPLDPSGRTLLAVHHGMRAAIVRVRPARERLAAPILYRFAVEAL